MTTLERQHHARSEEQENMDSTLQLVGFKLGEEEYCIDIHNIQEINKRMHITRVPKNQPFVKGVINLRGKVICVIDLRKRFGLPDNFDNDTRIMVIDLAHETMGFVVDSVTEVIRIPVNRVDPTPPLIGHISNEYLLGVGKTDKRLLIIIDLNRVVGFKNESGRYYESELERKIKRGQGTAIEEFVAVPKSEPKAAKPAPTPAPQTPVATAMAPVEESTPSKPALSEDELDNLDDLIALELKKREAEDAQRLAQQVETTPKGARGGEEVVSLPAEEQDDLDQLIAMELKKREAEDARRLAQQPEEEPEEEFPQMGEELSSLPAEELDDLDQLIALELKKREAEDAQRLEKLQQIEQEEPEEEMPSDDGTQRIDELIALELKKREAENARRLAELAEAEAAGKKPEPPGAPSEPQASVEVEELPGPAAEVPPISPAAQTASVSPDHNAVLDGVMGELSRQQAELEKIMGETSMRISEDELEELDTPDSLAAELEDLDSILNSVEKQDIASENGEDEWNIETAFRWPGTVPGRFEEDFVPEPLEDILDKADEPQSPEETEKKKPVAGREDTEQEVSLYLDELLAGSFSSDFHGDPEIGMLLSRIQSLLIASEVTINTAREEVPAIISALYDSSKYAERSTNRILDLSEKILQSNNAFQDEFTETRAQFGSLDSQQRLEKVHALVKDVDQSIDHVFNIMGAMEFQDITKQRIQKLSKKLRDFKATLADMDSLIPLGVQTSASQPTAQEPFPFRRPAEEEAKIERDQHAVNSLLRELGIE
ncbi:CheW domain protein [Desulfurispirillum indicum S5]|uniref:CheW domain protein n=1 Tax=Desulfurispirillum indicum (strain ATCC BAA-1389 / DSM 22839 / S5) TaxID=653733 RepID=E6W562_DESIS|nr:chemotaxis protein CheW [Desulfurispirillum indicum]ADU67141.1 CheW domain protein [Desulfurispirillum indicum S5]